jgi:hypothetical protein
LPSPRSPGIERGKEVSQNFLSEIRSALEEPALPHHVTVSQAKFIEDHSIAIEEKDDILSDLHYRILVPIAKICLNPVDKGEVKGNLFYSRVVSNSFIMRGLCSTLDFRLYFSS